ncbi:hypothetical protein F1721_24920 [Saccharopolyspora hirsuta]|uniref:Uncharacterized protein n=1 Tax=Saccharopolyspora hirsuta TaxID=1837 RepID=A0A5M7BIR6_SACHI|nr:hypothetical protein [Saccharopolyspora hirsuta]KAA5829562.1 hypothetical protein F1721_24920 [Saccharopolyspora hirsuta]
MSIRLDQDITAPTTVTMTTPTADGRLSIHLKPGQINADAQSLYGYHSCHYLASAISSMTGGWFLVTMTARPFGGDRDVHAHTGTITPAGRVIDVWREYPSVDAFRDYWKQRIVGADFLKVHAPVTPGQAIELVRQPGDTGTFRGNQWWTENPSMNPIHQHFARLVLEERGLAHHLLPQARPARQQTAPSPARAASATNATPSSGRTSLMGIGEIRQAVAISGKMANFARTALREARQQFEEIVSQLAAIGVDTSSQEGPKQALATYSQLRDQLDGFQGQIDTAMDWLEQYTNKF